MKEFNEDSYSGADYEDLRAAVCAALETNKYQSVSQLNKSCNLSVDDLLRVVEADTEISSVQVGEITVYFLKKYAPEGKLFNTGNGFSVKTADKSHSKTSKNETEISNPHRGHAAPTQAKLGANLKLIERFAAEGKTVRQLAAALEIPYSSANSYLFSKKYPQYGEAWRKGKVHKKAAESVEQEPRDELVYPVSFSGTEIEGLIENFFGGLFR